MDLLLIFNSPFSRYNRASNCEGAGVRLGGWLVDGHQFGNDNNVRFSKTKSKKDHATLVLNFPEGWIHNPPLGD